MHSAAHRSVTVVTLMTLIFTPMLKGHDWVNVLTGKTTETTIVRCKTMPVVIVAYVLVTAISNLQVISPWMLVFPIYAFLQVLVMPPIGAVHYVVLAYRRRRLGRYGFGYRRGPPAWE